MVLPGCRGPFKPLQSPEPWRHYLKFTHFFSQVASAIISNTCFSFVVVFSEDVLAYKFFFLFFESLPGKKKELKSYFQMLTPPLPPCFHW
jgi:hypothetical protein